MEPTPDERVSAPMQRINPTMVALLGGLLVLLLLIVLLTGRNRTDQDRLGDDQLNQTAAADPEKRCSSQRTYDLIKRELFRRAVKVRGSDQVTFNKLAASSVVRMDAPMLRSHDKDLGAVSCSGTLSLDLPPGVAVVGGRRTLSADINYSVQPAADRTGDILLLTNADAIITPLATLARVGGPAVDPLAPIGNAVAPAPGEVFAPGEGPAERTVPVGNSNPSFNCANAGTRGEIAVCNDPGLGALDRQMASQFNNALSSADPEERDLLQRTRNSFLSYRDRCGSNSCIAETYRGRMREISDIMAGRWSATR